MSEADTSGARVSAVTFPRDLLPLLRCSRDAGVLTAGEELPSGGAGIVDARLVCTACAAEYRIEDGIARLLDGPLTPEDQHEIALRNVEYASTTPDCFVPPDFGWRSELSDWLEIPPHLAALEPLDGCRVLELGCGDGRYTILMGHLGARVLAVDFSINALRKLSHWLLSGIAPTAYRPARRLPAAILSSRIGLVQADISQLHAAPRSFDRALSATPLDCRDERMRMYRAIADALADGGRLVGGVEHDDLARRLLGLPTARRYRQGGIFIEHFDPAAMRREAGPYFLRLRIRPIRPRMPFVHRLPLDWAVRISRAAGVLPVLRGFGELLLMRAERPVRPAVEGDHRAGSRLAKSLFFWYRRRMHQEPVWESDEQVARCGS